MKYKDTYFPNHKKSNIALHVYHNCNVIKIIYNISYTFKI